MIISVFALSVLVGGALIATIIAPILLLALFVRDYKHGGLW